MAVTEQRSATELGGWGAALAHNIAALTRTSPALARRLGWPCGDDHLVPGEGDAPPSYRLYDLALTLALPPEVIDRAVEAARGQDRVLLFGVGLGELLPALLDAHPSLTVLAWERDPAVLALALSREDVGEALSQGRLTLLMGVDLWRALGSLPQTVLYHPALGGVYQVEAEALSLPPPQGDAVLVATGGLLVADVIDCLRARGEAVWPVDVRRWSQEEVAYTAGAVGARALLCINHVHGLATFCEALELPLASWEIDPSTDLIQPEPGCDRARIFTYRAADLPELRAAGFTGATYLPLASNPRRRRPVELTGDERQRFGAPVAFVGSSMVAQARVSRRRFLQRFARWHPHGKDALPEARRIVDGVLAEQRRTPATYRIPQLLRPHFGAFLDALHEEGLDGAMLVAEAAAAERRLGYVAALAPFEVSVWGDGSWASLDAHGVRYRGPAGHDRELTLIYNAAAVHVDIGRLYQRDIVTMRVFDVMACGGFLIAERSDALGELFSLGEEVEAYDTLSELVEKVGYYLAHPEAARAIAHAGRRAVLTRHSMDDRVAELMGLSTRKPVVTPRAAGTFQFRPAQCTPGSDAPK